MYMPMLECNYMSNRLRQEIGKFLKLRLSPTVFVFMQVRLEVFVVGSSNVDVDFNIILAQNMHPT